MNGEIEHRVRIMSCLQLGKSATETPEMLLEAFKPDSGFRIALTLKGLSNIKSDMYQQNDRQCWKKFENSPRKVIVEQSMRSKNKATIVKHCENIEENDLIGAFEACGKKIRSLCIFPMILF
jgi:hypothetical protein